VPIVGATQDIPFIRSLELNLAGRYDHYEGIREEPLSPRVTLRYQPVEDLTLRGSWSNSFVAPTLYQLYGPQRIEPGVSFNIVTVSGPVLTGSNADLSPSTADAYTAGIIYKPRFARD
jgi:iron complex outermembrane receptor protein